LGDNSLFHSAFRTGSEHIPNWLCCNFSGKGIVPTHSTICTNGSERAAQNIAAERKKYEMQMFHRFYDLFFKGFCGWLLFERGQRECRSHIQAQFMSD
jgi:hypothetical protein